MAIVKNFTFFPHFEIRHRSSEGISDEILLRSSARHSRNNSETTLPSNPSATDKSPAVVVHHWFSTFLHPPPPAANDPAASPLTLLPPPSKPQSRRKSRFLPDDPPSDAPPPPLPPGRTFAPAPPPPDREDRQLLLSPPRHLVESAHRRSISSSTCSLDKLSRLDDARRSVSVGAAAGRRLEAAAASVVADDVSQINAFLRRQRVAIARISAGEVSDKAKIVLSGTSNSSTSSIVAAICYAWMLENKEEKEEGVVAAPVVNMRREKMWRHKQAAWLFHHLGIDASTLLFANEVDLEGLIMARQLSILVVGQDVLKTNGEVGSYCTVLTDNYCEDAYNLLQTPNLKKLLLAGILLDTQNLNSAAKFFTNRDAEAVQLLSVGSAPNYRHEIFEQLMQDHTSGLFLEALRSNYGKPPNDDKDECKVLQEHRISTRKSTSTPSKEVHVASSTNQKLTPVLVSIPAPAPAPEPAPAPVKASETANHGKNKFFLAKWFGFGSK